MNSNRRFEGNSMRKKIVLKSAIALLGMGMFILGLDVGQNFILGL